MKKIYVTIIFVLASMGVCKAQFFLGGELGVWGSSGKNVIKTKSPLIDTAVEVKDPSTFNFVIAPKLGYFINDKLSVGVILSYNLRTTTVNAPTKVKTTTHTFGGSPYVRYAFAQAGNFSFIAEGRIDIMGGTWNVNPSAAVYTKNTLFSAGVRVAPVITYNLGKHLVFESRLNFLSLGYTHSREKTKGSLMGVDVTDVTVSNDFNVSIDTDNTFVTIGMVYKF